jgi:hypothetical protein
MLSSDKRVAEKFVRTHHVDELFCRHVREAVMADDCIIDLKIA